MSETLDRKLQDRKTKDLQHRREYLDSQQVSVAYTDNSTSRLFYLEAIPGLNKLFRDKVKADMVEFGHSEESLADFGQIFDEAYQNAFEHGNYRPDQMVVSMEGKRYFTDRAIRVETEVSSTGIELTLSGWLPWEFPDIGNLEHPNFEDTRGRGHWLMKQYAKGANGTMQYNEDGTVLTFSLPFEAETKVREVI